MAASDLCRRCHHRRSVHTTDLGGHSTECSWYQCNCSGFQEQI